MARSVPDGWTKVDKYHMTKANMSIARAFVAGRMKWTLWVGDDIIGSEWDDDGGFDKMIARSKQYEMRSAA